jgi:hypothetical protein
VYNFLARVTEVVDGRTFDVILDKGFREFAQRRLQMQGVELPNPRLEKTEESRDLFDKAKQCLSCVLFGWNSVEDSEGGSSEDEIQGRGVIVSPMHPNRYGRAFVRVYVKAERENINYPQLGAKYAGYRFLHVNNLMQLVAERKYDMEEVISICKTFELRDF